MFFAVSRSRSGTVAYRGPDNIYDIDQPRGTRLSDRAYQSAGTSPCPLGHRRDGYIPTWESDSHADQVNDAVQKFTA
jgi:hypothetical protein